MKVHALALALVVIALGVAQASAQNANVGGNAATNAAQTGSSRGSPQVAAQTPPTSGLTASQQQVPAAGTPTPTPPAGLPSGKSATIGTATINPTGIPPSQRNPLLADNGDVRISKMIGVTIYNRDDKKVGNIDEVLAAQNGRLQVVISTSNKKAVVPWDSLVFGDAKLNSDNKILMPDATQAQLDKMEAFDYQKTNDNKK